MVWKIEAGEIAYQDVKHKKDPKKEEEKWDEARAESICICAEQDFRPFKEKVMSTLMHYINL